ncbi:MAG: inorganic pyrophosphatase [Nonlabens sp.]
MTNAKAPLYILLLLLFIICNSCIKLNNESSQADINFLTDFSPQHPNGDINVVIEIPAGTLEKWEVTKPSGELALEQINRQPRIVQYIGYPGNYGMIPQTLLPKSAGGDGDPLDVLVLGSSVKRGSVIKAKVLGVLRLLDGGEQDDKLIAVQADSPLYHLNSIEELVEDYKGITGIIETWFSNYKGPGKLESNGYADRTRANEILEVAIAAYKEAQE